VTAARITPAAAIAAAAFLIERGAPIGDLLLAFAPFNRALVERRMVNGEVEWPPIGWIKIGLDSYVDPDKSKYRPFCGQSPLKTGARAAQTVAPLGATVLVVQQAAGDGRGMPPNSLFPMARAGGSYELQRRIFG
jgi:hypothetical protein